VLVLVQVRHYAIVILQRALLSPALARAPPQACFSCFHQARPLSSASARERECLTTCGRAVCACVCR
jgi:hypothetical protein